MDEKSSNDDLLRADLQQSLKHSPVDPRELSSFQRILITTDGMVTEMLEAHLWERMNVVVLSQDEIQSEAEIEDLQLDRGETVLRREILLRGRMSHQNHLYASSMIVPDRLDDRMRDGLLNGVKPIGLLILEDKLETFREILGCNREPAGALAKHFQIEESDPLISRTYRVMANRTPIMLITEKFPATAFR